MEMNGTCPAIGVANGTGPFLESLGEGLTAELLARGTVHVYGSGEQIFSADDMADFLPVILRGRVKLVRYPEPGKELIMGIFEAGDAFAIPPALDGTRFPASAVAMDESRLLLLARHDFLSLMGSSPEFSSKILERMCSILRHHARVITIMAKPSAAHRVAGILIELAEEHRNGGNGKISYRRQDIAEMSGLTVESTIRAVRKLADRGLVRIVRGSIYVDSVKPLHDFVS
jgi:CRP-like cAMP-binding protein